MLGNKVQSWSELKSAKFYRHLDVGRLSVAGGGSAGRPAKILVARHPARGVGDLLFITGILHWLASKYNVEIYWHAPIESSTILGHLPFIKTSMPVSGPILYDTLPLYDFHWFIDAVTEYDEEPDQENVYDCLFRQIGVNPELVSSKYKRPWVVLAEHDSEQYRNFEALLKHQYGLELDQGNYVVLSPTAKSITRTAPYSLWLKLIDQLVSQKVQVIITAATGTVVPAAGTSFNEFLLELKSKPVVNLSDQLDLKMAAAILKHARCLITLDSGLLYIAESLGTPAISLWGTHDPTSRIGYNAGLMANAIWKKNACPWAPCYAYRGFPAAPECGFSNENNGDTCAALTAITAEDIMAKYNQLPKNTDVSYLGSLTKGVVKK